MTPSISVMVPGQGVGVRQRGEFGPANREHETFLLRFSDAIRSCDDSDELQRTACRLLGEHLKVDRVHYGEIRGDERIAVIGPDYCTPARPA